MAYEAARSISLIPVSTAIGQRLFVTLNSSGNVALPAANGHAVGITLEDSANGDQEAIPVALLDGSKVEVIAGGTVAIGAFVGAAADGQAVAVTAAGNRALGIALTAGTDGQVMTILTGVQGFAANAS